MMHSDFSILDLPYGVIPDPDDFLQAAMRWHFGEDTGSPFWLRRRQTLDFDPLTDVRSYADLKLFPNVTDELRDVPVFDLIPRGFGNRPEVVAIIESGGTTGAPKRLPLLKHFADLMANQMAQGLAASGADRKPLLAMMPGGPHGALEQTRRGAALHGVVVFSIDIDPRWVKKELAAGHVGVVQDYTAHLLEQARSVLESYELGGLHITPPMLARITEHDDLTELVRNRVQRINWGGAHMDADSRFLYRTAFYPNTALGGGYGTTMALGAGATERPGLGHDSPCVFDPTFSPYVTLRVVDPETGEAVAEGERGQLVVNHVSKSFLLPNNAERDMATRIAPASEQIGDSIADITPQQTFAGVSVVEGVY